MQFEKQLFSNPQILESAPATSRSIYDMDNMAQIDCHFVQTIYWHMNYKGMAIHWHDIQFTELLDREKY